LSHYLYCQHNIPVTSTDTGHYRNTGNTSTRSITWQMEREWYLANWLHISGYTTYAETRACYRESSRL